MLTIYIDDGFLKEFEKMGPEDSYGIKFLWELNSSGDDNPENHTFIFDDKAKTPEDLNGLILSSPFKIKSDRGNIWPKPEKNRVSAHLLFVTKKEKINIKTKGLIFTLEDFEERIEEYAAMDNFLGFLESETDWDKYLIDFKKFPCNNFYMTDAYFFDHKNNIAFLTKLFLDPQLKKSRCKIYTNTVKTSEKRLDDEKKRLDDEKKMLDDQQEKLYYREKMLNYNRKQQSYEHKKKINDQKKNLIKDTMECLQKENYLSSIEVNNSHIEEDKNSHIIWHDRELVTDYAMVMSGIGFKSSYGNHTNNKISQCNIFTKDGRRLIKEQLKRFTDYDNIEKSKRVFCSYPEPKL